MTVNTKKTISKEIEKLSDQEQEEVLNFVISLQQRKNEAENDAWNQFSLQQAMRGLEDDNLPEYTEADLVEKWQ